jgi:hypothetical protein
LGSGKDGLRGGKVGAGGLNHEIGPRIFGRIAQLGSAKEDESDLVEHETAVFKQCRGAFKCQCAEIDTAVAIDITQRNENFLCRLSREA